MLYEKAMLKERKGFALLSRESYGANNQPIGGSKKRDKLHNNDHWDVSDKKGRKIREVDLDGNKIWPNGPKNKNKAP